MTASLPAQAYRDLEQYERERRAIFARTWQLAGFRAQLRAPGEYVTFECAGFDVIVVVDDDGSLRAFHNVCRHRAGPLVENPHGQCTSFVCRYHGWSYARDGSLRSARDFGGDVPSDLALFGVAVAEWRGLVFVHLGDAPSPLPNELGGFFAAFADQSVEQMRYSHRVVHEVACNWKTYADNYMEGYHVPLVHPELNREIDAKRYRVTVGDHWCEHSAPTRSGAVNAGRWLWRFPNLALNLYPDGMNVERFLPLGAARTAVVYDYFFTDLGAAERNAEVERIGTTILDEDRRICEAVQRNLDAGIYDTGLLSPRHEAGVAALQRWIREALDGVG